ncbi:MAG: histidine phosphatase family protein [Thaumarchaeota archaeon]|nr:histidine phosphatase family protein [Nitrososphaerota archaeon]MCY3976453.1 histidine phosphatase family protein [Nitrososphaerota archaeon]
MTTIILLRHGQAINNTKRILAGRSNGINLTAEGVDQARNIAELIRPLNISAIYSSPIQRAKKTAEIVAATNSIDYFTDSRLIELEMGEFTGMKYENLFSKYGNVFLKFYEGDPEIAHHGVETFHEVKNRISDIVNFVSKKHLDQKVLLVTHMDPIKAMISNVVEIKPKSLFELVVANASLTIINNDHNKLSILAINLMNMSRYQKNFI